MKIANTLSILLAIVLGIISAQWIFSPESAAQSLSMVYMEGDARNTQVRDFTAFFLGTSIMCILSFITKQYQWIFSAGLIFLIAVGEVLIGLVRSMGSEFKTHGMRIKHVQIITISIALSNTLQTPST